MLSKTAASSQTRSRAQEFHAKSENLGFKSSRTWLTVFAALVYVPILLMQMGKVESDTKQYLYLDPGRLLTRAATIWDPSVGMGTVSHQTLGYLFPSGPFFWIAETFLRMPAWVAQRLWLATIIFLAGLGMRYMLRTLGVRGAGVPIAMLVYAFSPYVVQYAGIYSVFLGPWAALPWWIGFTARGARRGGWKYPALFAITVQLVGALNATALALAALGPMLWLVHEVVVIRQVSLRRAFSLAWRTTLLTILTSLWWLVGLLVEGKYGVNLLRFTETLQSVAATSLPFEFMRGLGYWFFYGRDAIGVWEDGLRNYTNSVVVLAGLAIPALAMLGAALVRWRHAVFFVAVILLGLAISVGASPYAHPSLFGEIWKAFASGSNTGMALRNSGRAVPLIVLGVAGLLGAAVSAGVAKLHAMDMHQLGVGVVVVLVTLCTLNAAGAWAGNYYSTYLERSEQIPSYWTQAINALKPNPNNTRVLALPGSDFASYVWGDTRDPIEPGLMDRPYVARDIVPLGSPAAINLLQAVDTPLQAGVFEPNSLAPIAQLMGVGDVVLRNDLETDRWGVVSASEVWRIFTKKPPVGLSAPKTYGTTTPPLVFADIGDPSLPVADQPPPPPVAILSVNNPLPIVRTKSIDAPLVVDGDGTGLVDLSAAGLLDSQRLVLYSASYQDDPQFLRALPTDSELVVTDSNRLRGERWSRMFNNFGYTEEAGEKALAPNPFDQPLDTFPNTTDAARTVTIMRGVKQVTATTYGDQILGFTPAERPSRALDGDTSTAWTVDGGLPVGHERIVVQLDSPITTDHVNLVQLLGSTQARWITGVDLLFDGKSKVHATLDSTSRSKTGQTVTFPTHTFSTFELDIANVHGNNSGVGNANAVGFSEIRLADDTSTKPLQVDEAARLPEDLLDALGTASLAHPLAIVVSKDAMDDASMQRQFSLPTTRSFTLSGTAVISTNAKDDAIDRRLGIPDAVQGGVTATSKFTSNEPVARASSALDGDMSTAWNTQLGMSPSKDSITVTVPKPITFDHLDLAYLEDFRHSPPTQIQITSDDGTKRLVNLPRSKAKPNALGVIREPVSFPALTGKTFRFVVTHYAPVKSNGVVMPVGIAELGIPGVQRAAPPATLPGTCISDLLSIDGKPFPVRVVGSSTDAIEQEPLALEPCAGTTTVTLSAGTHEIDARISPKTTSALDIDHLVLSSASGGSAAPASTVANFTPSPADPAPTFRIVKQGRASMTVQVASASAPFWFELGESNNSGWTAKANGHDLGPSQLVDGYANGWRVTPTAPGSPVTITLDWTPQHAVWKAILISLGSGILCLGVVAFAFVRRRRRAADEDEEPAYVPPPLVRENALATDSPRTRRGVWPVVIASGVVAAVLVRPWIGILVAVFVFLALSRPRWRVALRFAAGAIMLCVALGIAVTQQLQHYPAVFQWPTFFDWARDPTWVAVVLLVADALASFVSHDDGTRDDDDLVRSGPEVTSESQAQAVRNE